MENMGSVIYIKWIFLFIYLFCFVSAGSFLVWIWTADCFFFFWVGGNTTSLNLVFGHYLSCFESVSCMNDSRIRDVGIQNLGILALALSLFFASFIFLCDHDFSKYNFCITVFAHLHVALTERGVRLKHWKYEFTLYNAPTHNQFPQVTHIYVLCSHLTVFLWRRVILVGFHSFLTKNGDQYFFKNKYLNISVILMGEIKCIYCIQFIFWIV